MSARDSISILPVGHIRTSVKVGQSGYRRGCRCSGCRAGANRAAAEYRAQPINRERILQQRRSPEFRAKHRKESFGHERWEKIKAWKKKHGQSVEFLAEKARRTQEINSIKLRCGCVDCGYRGHPVALDFDHVKGEKRREISDMMSYGWGAILEEMNKCEVVCANCHRIRTYKQKQAKKNGRVGLS